VTRARRLVEDPDPGVASPDDARRMLGLKGHHRVRF
jgi:hypothetical protein